MFKGGFYSYAKRFIELLPIYEPKESDKQEYEEILDLVDRLLDLYPNIGNSRYNQGLLSREISVYEERINDILLSFYEIESKELSKFLQ